MNQPTASPQQKRMDAIRNRVALAAPDWTFAADGDGFVLTAGGKDGSATVATIPATAPFADSEMILNAVSDLVWLLDAYTKLAGAYREILGELKRQARNAGNGEAKRKNYSAECAIKCAEPAFKAFLEECHGLDRPLTDDRVVTRIHSILAIRSRRELDTDTAAAERWKKLRDHFDAWRRRG